MQSELLSQTHTAFYIQYVSVSGLLHSCELSLLWKQVHLCVAKSITDKTPTDSAGWTGSTVIQYRAVYSWRCQTDIYRHGYWLTAIHWGNCSLKLWEKLVVKKEYLSNLKIWSSVFVPLMWTDVNWAENDATKWIPNGFTCGLCHREQMSEWIAASLNSSVFTESS